MVFAAAEPSQFYQKMDRRTAYFWSNFEKRDHKFLLQSFSLVVAAVAAVAASGDVANAVEKSCGKNEINSKSGEKVSQFSFQ